MFIYNTEISNGLICLCTNNMLSLFADDFYLFSWRETRDRETEGEQAKQMQQNRYTVKTNKKTTKCNMWWSLFILWCTNTT